MIKAEPVADFKRAIDAAENRIRTAIRERARVKPYATYCAISDGLIMLLGLNTGYRVSDLLEIRRKDVERLKSFSNGLLEYQHHINIKEGKTGKYRSVPILPYVYDYIQEQGAVLADGFLDIDLDTFNELPIFYNPRTGKHFHRVWVNKRLAMILPKRLNMGRTISPHSLRKSFAFKIYEASGNEILAVTRELNHSSPSVTMAYLGISDEQRSNLVLKAMTV
jgi:integrase